MGTRFLEEHKPCGLLPLLLGHHAALAALLQHPGVAQNSLFCFSQDFLPNHMPSMTKNYSKISFSLGILT